MSSEHVPSAPRATYPRSRIALHWLTLALLVAGAGLGFVMSDLDPGDPLRLWLGRAHFAVGLTMGVTLVARVVARFRTPPVAALPLPERHRRLIAFVHGALYVLAFAVVGSGMATSMASGWPAYLSGEVATAPSFEGIALREVHEAMLFTLLALVVVHVVGVARHEATHGGALRRMLGGPAAPGA